MGACMTKLDPVVTKCQCPDPECLGYLVDNLVTRNGRFGLKDAKLIARRKELEALIPRFRAILNTNLLDVKEREFIAYLNGLQRDLGA